VKKRVSRKHGVRLQRWLGEGKRWVGKRDFNVGHGGAIMPDGKASHRGQINLERKDRGDKRGQREEKGRNLL